MRISHVGFALPSGILNDSLLETITALNTLRKYEITNMNGYITKIFKNNTYALSKFFHQSYRRYYQYIDWRLT